MPLYRRNVSSIAKNGSTPLTGDVTLTGGSNVTLTQSGQDVSIATTAPGITWTEVSGTSQSAAVNSGYILNNASLVVLTLPTTAAVGDMLYGVGKGAGGWRLGQNASQIVHIGVTNTSTGVGGQTNSTNRYDCLILVCTVANTEWTVISAVGNFNTI